MGPERFHIKDTSFGGKLSDYDNSYQMDSKVTNFSFKIIPPRSSSTTQMEVYQNCVKNYQIINKDFRTVIQQLNHSQIHDTVLIINDFSIFLHLGSHIPLLKILKSHLTVFVNAYYGQKLADDFGSQISWREKVLVQLLSRHFDYSIYLVK